MYSWKLITFDRVVASPARPSQREGLVEVGVFRLDSCAYLEIGIDMSFFPCAVCYFTLDCP